MRVLSLFSGVGLGDLGLTMAGMEIVGQCEKEKFCLDILKLRWPDVYKWEDIKNVTGKEVKQKSGAIDLVAGGFPCQPFSTAGNQRGDQDDRHLWPEMLRVISEVRPTWVLGENVPGIIPIALDDVLNDLEACGYTTMPPIVFPAHACGAPHRRDRVWIVGYSKCHGRNHAVQDAGGSKSGSLGARRAKGSIKAGNAARSNRGRRRDSDVANAIGNAPRRSQQSKAQREIGCVGYDWDKVGDDFRNSSGFWSVEPQVGRVVNGVPGRMDRLKALGNGQVVHCVEWLGKKIMEANREIKT